MVPIHNLSLLHSKLHSVTHFSYVGANTSLGKILGLLLTHTSKVTGLLILFDLVLTGGKKNTFYFKTLDCNKMHQKT